MRGRPYKEHVDVHLKFDAYIWRRLEAYAEEIGATKTAVVEAAVLNYLIKVAKEKEQQEKSV